MMAFLAVHILSNFILRQKQFQQILCTQLKKYVFYSLFPKMMLLQISTNLRQKHEMIALAIGLSMILLELQYFFEIIRRAAKKALQTACCVACLRLSSAINHYYHLFDTTKNDAQDHLVKYFRKKL